MRPIPVIPIWGHFIKYEGNKFDGTVDLTLNLTEDQFYKFISSFRVNEVLGCVFYELPLQPQDYRKENNGVSIGRKSNKSKARAAGRWEQARLNLSQLRPSLESQRGADNLSGDNDKNGRGAIGDERGGDKQ